MSNEIDRINELLEKLGLSQHQAVKALLEETDHAISQSTISRILKGEARSSITAFVRYALENIKERQVNQEPEGYLGCHQTHDDSEAYSLTYFVRAETAAEAIKKLAHWGFDVQGRRNETDFDCSGLWCASPAHPKLATFISAMNAWAVTMNWHLDV